MNFYLSCTVSSPSNADQGDLCASYSGENIYFFLTYFCLRFRDIRNNEISWAIEDSIGVFVGMKKLNTL